MRGIIETEFHHAVNNGINHIFICGDDGNSYFGHRTEFKRKAKHYKKGRVVTFDVQDNGRAHPDAVGIDVEVPAQPDKEDELVSIRHLPDGAYVKRIRKPNGTEVTMIVKDHTLLLSGIPEYERDMIWMYQRGPSGRAL